jgi:nitroreductase
MAAESLGLGSCMIGSVTPVYKRGGKAFIRKYGIPDYAKYGIAVIFGYPKYRYHKAIRRSFAHINFIDKV